MEGRRRKRVEGRRRKRVEEEEEEGGGEEEEEGGGKEAVEGRRQWREGGSGEGGERKVAARSAQQTSPDVS